MLYTIVIHKDPTSDFGVIVPDLPGCFSAGDTLEDAVLQAREAIELHLEGMLSDNEPIPQPQSMEKHRENPEFADGIFSTVDVDLTELENQISCVA